MGKNFNDLVRNAWNLNINGCAMYQVVKKLKNVKLKLKILNRVVFKQIQASDSKATLNLREDQLKLHHDDTNIFGK